MRRLTRFLLIVLATLPAAGLLVWLLTAAPAPPARALPAVTTTPSPTPPVFTATLDVMPDRQLVRLGETLVVTLSLTVGEGCDYTTFAAQLTQSGHNLPAFAYIDPITDTIGPGVLSLPVSYTLQAIAPGYVTLDGRLDGEQYCGGAWIWTTIYGTSPSIKVEEWPYLVRLPMTAGP